MLESFEVSVTLPADQEAVYKAWLSSEEHSAFTGAKAFVDPSIGGEFSAWDGYITGRTLELDPPKRIVQAWRTTEFPPESKDSILEIVIEKAKAGCKLTLKHSAIPEGQGENYTQGWKDFYFKPMKRYFQKR